ncbi:MAG: alpha-ketoacid dehydrogenase subunit beta [Clostridiales bacterium]|nr:alpha-ketoacid dehydrogenase subunit beta [Clostridiales bacterium]
MKKITYAKAIKEGISEEMRRDSTVFMIGEDIGVYRGTFGVSDGMLEEFSKERIIDTPVSETAFMGVAIGSAMTGLRPVVELMFSDFMAVCYDQIINQAAKMHFAFKEKVPMVIRTASGAGTGASFQHSQSLEQMYAHVPGLKVVMPATPYDAKGLIKSAIKDDNPVVFLESKALYNDEDYIPDDEYSIPLGVADVKREGKDVSIITYGRMVKTALESAKRLEKEGVDVEIIDLRTLVPLDTNAIISTAKKTGRVLIVHEAVKFAGFGGEILSTIIESDAFNFLKTNVRRLGLGYHAIPFNKNLEEEVFPTVEKIEFEIKDMLKQKSQD